MKDIFKIRSVQYWMLFIIEYNNISKDFFDNRVVDIHVAADNKIYACGDFHLYNGEVKKRFVKLNSDGSISQ
jgi:hypothetical protein